eukprot:Clim_evm8s251 gene=Clim_evmTU8s251
MKLTYFLVTVAAALSFATDAIVIPRVHDDVLVAGGASNGGGEPGSDKEHRNLKSFLYAGPVIGVMTENVPADYVDKGDQYIAASYVKWIESAGGRVVPIPYDAPIAHLDFLFERINGIVFPGGGVDVGPGSQWYDTGLHILKKVKEATHKGEHFPVWGTCLGLELLICVAAEANLLDTTNAEDISLPLNFVGDPRNSRLFENAPASVIETLAFHNSTNNNHEFGVLVKDFNRYTALHEFWNLVSTSSDRDGAEFISTIEAKDYPVWAVQWHPEKPQFEWKPWGQINHDTDTVAAMQYMTNFFIGEARKNKNHFDSVQQLDKFLIYNYIPTFGGQVNPAFMEVYVFNRVDLLNPRCETC